MKVLVIWKANWILFDFVFWYNIDFVICGSLKSMCMVVGFYFFLKRKRYFKEPHKVWETLKKNSCTFIYFKIFQGSPILLKDKIFVSRVMWTVEISISRVTESSLREGMIVLQWLLSTGWVFCTGSTNGGQWAKEGQRAKRTG